MIGHHHTDGHHDDFGGLQRDHPATGANMDRRLLLRIARFGAGLAALPLLGRSSGGRRRPQSGSLRFRCPDRIASRGVP
jgi:hypothetical protein